MGSWSDPLVIAGIVIFIIGLAMLVAYLVLYFSTYNNKEKPSWLWIFLIGGIIFLILGAVLAVWGLNREPSMEEGMKTATTVRYQ